MSDQIRIHPRLSVADFEYGRLDIGYRDIGFFLRPPCK